MDRSAHREATRAPNMTTTGAAEPARPLACSTGSPGLTKRTRRRRGFASACSPLLKWSPSSSWTRPSSYLQCLHMDAKWEWVSPKGLAPHLVRAFVCRDEWNPRANADGRRTRCHRGLPPQVYAAAATRRIQAVEDGDHAPRTWRRRRNGPPRVAAGSSGSTGRTLRRRHRLP